MVGRVRWADHPERSAQRTLLESGTRRPRPTTHWASLLPRLSWYWPIVGLPDPAH